MLMLLLLLLLSPPLDRWPTFRLLLLLLLLLPPPPPQPQPQSSFAPVPRAKYHRETFCAKGTKFISLPVRTSVKFIYLQSNEEICFPRRGWWWSEKGCFTTITFYYAYSIFVESNGRKQFPGAASACCCCSNCGRPRHAFISRTLSLSFEEFPRKERPINLGYNFRIFVSTIRVAWGRFSQQENVKN